MMSCSDSKTEQKGARPSYWRIVSSASLRPVRILCGIGLVADVPEDLVRRRVEQAVQGNRELTGAEVGAEVAADLADRVDDELADLLGHPLELLVGEPLQIGRRVDRVEQPPLRFGVVLILGHQVCLVWMKSVIRARSSVFASVSASASRALRCD